MRALSSGSVLLDLHTSWNSSNEIPISTTFAYFSSSFRQTRRGRKGIASSSTPLSSSFNSNSSSSSIRRPSDRFSNGSIVSSSTPLLSLSTSKELELFLELVPLRMRNELLRHEDLGSLIEVVIDLGRKPIARFPSGDWVISDQTVKLEDLHHAISKVGEFSDDNRSGIDHSLHRISAIRNRKMQIIGLTCRFGRAIAGNAEMIRDLVEGGGSILVIGRPGVGKTTLIREIARMLADDHLRRVIIVDTSNEIGGDGDIPHSGIGRARRMQVPNVNLQHNVMIEAVENHMPETIIIDEIGTELEALAASTIAQRGVQLVGTAHGMTIENIIKNPSLQILVGGIESVTLGDEEARKRKVQKTILERKGPPAFSCAIEMISKTDYHVHHRLDATVDAILAGKLPLFEVRRLEEKANDSVTTVVEPEKHNLQESKITENEYNSTQMESIEDSKEHPVRRMLKRSNTKPLSTIYKSTQMESIEDSTEHPVRRMLKRSNTKPLSTRTSTVCVYTYKILEADLLQVAEVMGLEDVLDVTDDIGTADAILASSSELKQNRWIRSVAKFHKLPIFVIKSNTMAHMVKAVRMILGMESFSSPSLHLLSPSAADIEIEDDAPERKPSLEEIDALEEVRLAIEYIVIPGGEAVELLPRRSEIIARQMELVESYQLSAEKSGTELNPRLQILPLRLSKNIYSAKNSRSSSRKPIELTLADDSSVGGAGGTGVARLPLLPE